MSIDGIGRSGPKGPTSGVSDVSDAGGADFKQALGTDPASPALSASGSEALGRLSRGELNLDQYLDIQVGDAVSHLRDRLSPEQLEFVSQTLRDQLSSDPVLLELVRRATGATPSERTG
jgi:hypothetical protein